MANLPSIKLISREDLKEAPSWIERLLSPLNSFMAAVYENLNRGLTFRQNIRCNIKEVRFATPSNYVAASGFTEIVFATGLRVKADGVILLQLYQTDVARTEFITLATSFDWIELEGEIHVRFIAGLDDSHSYFARFLVI